MQSEGYYIEIGKYYHGFSNNSRLVITEQPSQENQTEKTRYQEVSIPGGMDNRAIEVPDLGPNSEWTRISNTYFISLSGKNLYQINNGALKTLDQIAPDGLVAIRYRGSNSDLVFIDTNSENIDITVLQQNVSQFQLEN